MNKEDIIRMAREAGGRQVDVYWDMTIFMLERFAKLAAAAEREVWEKAYEAVCDERDAIAKDADKAYALLRRVETEQLIELLRKVANDD